MLPARNLTLLSTMRTAGRPAVMGRGFFLSTSTRLGLKESANRSSSSLSPNAIR
jgi:hypothetical protein